MTQRDLMLAVLSMDAYFDRTEGWRIGNATISIPPAVQTNGFAAFAYQWNGETIISYRGTDDLSDVLHGWSAGVGFQASQTYLAAQFYKQAAGGSFHA